MRHLDLFSGIGGFALAAQWAGIETVGFCEIDSYCQKVLKKHWANIPIHKDIKTLKNGGQFGTVDIITGGFPCQPFSIAGKRKGKRDDRDLWPEMFRVIKEFKPTWIIGENVANFVKMGLERTATNLESEGYEVQAINIPACAVSAPHQRARVWIIAYPRCKPLGAGKKRLDSQQKNCTEKKFKTKKRNRFADLCENVAYSKSEQNRGMQQPRMEPNFRANRKTRNENMAYAHSKNAQRQWKKPFRNGEACQPSKRDWWAIEPELGRVANGIPNRVDRLKCLGNAIVPQVAYEIMRFIYEIHKSSTLGS